MSQEQLKLELIEWLTLLDDPDTLQLLKAIKSQQLAVGQDWWEGLAEEEKARIDRGLEDVASGRLTSHEEVRKKYGPGS